MTKQRRDGGYTLIELLLVIVVLGILATIVVAAVGGFTADAEDAACLTDAKTLEMAAEAFFAQRAVSVIDPPAGSTGADRYEQRLVDGGFLHTTSSLFDLDATGQLVAVGSSCVD